ncbi:MAG: autotransporter domain-containing protein, partial [Bradyrhizobium guangdongense]
MRSAPPSETGRMIGLGRLRRFAAALVLALAFGLSLAAAPAFAQSPSPSPTPTPTPTPSPTPIPSPTATNYERSIGNTTMDLGSNFLERLGNQASNGINRTTRNNPGGGGASSDTEAPRYRTWFEGYGI